MKVLFVIANHDFRDEELFETKEVLEKAKIECKISNTSGQPAKGTQGKIAVPDFPLHKANPEEFSAIIFVGGSGALEYVNNNIVLDLAKKFAQTGKVVAAICIAPVILAKAGVLSGKKATVWPSGKDEIQAVCQYTGADVEIDGKIITASGPKAAKAFGKAIVGALK